MRIPYRYCNMIKGGQAKPCRPLYNLSWDMFPVIDRVLLYYPISNPVKHCPVICLWVQEWRPSRGLFFNNRWPRTNVSLSLTSSILTRNHYRLLYSVFLLLSFTKIAKLPIDQKTRLFKMRKCPRTKSLQIFKKTWWHESILYFSFFKIL